MKTFIIDGKRIPIPSLIQEWDYFINPSSYESISFFKKIRMMNGREVWFDVFIGEDSLDGEFMISLLDDEFNPYDRDDWENHLLICEDENNQLPEMFGMFGLSFFLDEEGMENLFMRIKLGIPLIKNPFIMKNYF